MHRIITIGLTLLLIKIYLNLIIVDAIKQNKYTFMSSETATRHEFNRRKRTLLLKELVLKRADTNCVSALVALICALPGKNVAVNITNIFFASNNTGEGFFTCKINNSLVGTFNNCGIVSVEILPLSGQIGQPVILGAGNFTFEIDITTDTVSIILSGIKIDTENQNPDVDILCERLYLLN
jgi:hypothetical protein